MSKTLTGSCLCGRIHYTVTGEPAHFYHCHCSRCRKASGTGHASNMFVKGSLTWESGEELVSRFKLPEAERFTNTFCRQCGGRLPRANEATGVVMIPVGSLDVEPGFEPEARIFMGSRTAWSCRDGRLPEFDGYAG